MANEAGPRINIEVNFERCEATGFCAEVAPEVFEIGDDGKLRLLVETAGAALAGRLREAEELCPTRAITVTTSD